MEYCVYITAKRPDYYKEEVTVHYLSAESTSKAIIEALRYKRDDLTVTKVEVTETLDFNA